MRQGGILSIRAPNLGGKCQNALGPVDRHARDSLVDALRRTSAGRARVAGRAGRGGADVQDELLLGAIALSTGARCVRRDAFGRRGTP